ncbi:MAG: MgtC/SapB family protein [Candidatus Pacebacteria bacterium]|nr:MgtC/SapB family protein [Candidatus Paceibacterota bacterium]MCF7862925.1 MgtC/SapB family protein [Candidatus Paceibacterota bacterium]
MEQFFAENSDIFLKLIVALVLGMFIGAERTLVHKEAGMKTHALVSLGAALFMIISEMTGEKYASIGGFDPIRMASQIVVGIGFLGAGMVIFQGSKVRGLTTAGGLWVVGGIGVATGLGFFTLAITATILVLVIFVFLNILENPIRKMSNEIEKEKEEHQ